MFKLSSIMQYLGQTWNSMKLIQNATDGTKWNTVGNCGTEWNKNGGFSAELNLYNDAHLWK